MQREIHVAVDRARLTGDAEVTRDGPAGDRLRIENALADDAEATLHGGQRAVELLGDVCVGVPLHLQLRDVPHLVVRQ